MRDAQPCASPCDGPPVANPIRPLGNDGRPRNSDVAIFFPGSEGYAYHLWLIVSLRNILILSYGAEICITFKRRKGSSVHVVRPQHVCRRGPRRIRPQKWHQTSCSSYRPCVWCCESLARFRVSRAISRSQPAEGRSCRFGDNPSNRLSPRMFH